VLNSKCGSMSMASGFDSISFLIKLNKQLFINLNIINSKILKYSLG